MIDAIADPPPRRLLAASLACLALLLTGVPAEATHRIDQRFTVWGQVTYSDDAPVPGQTVLVVVANGRDAVRLKTDADGWYRKVLSVDNSGLGKVFDVKVRNMVEHVSVEFDPQDMHTERGKRVDFVITQ